MPPALDTILGRMLAREPRDRYQTASELIVDLERSRLAAPSPSFADPDLASQGPVGAGVPGHVSRANALDPDLPRKPEPAAEAEAETVWLLRFRNRAGRVCRTHATTDQIVERMRKAGCRNGSWRGDRLRRGSGRWPLSPEFRANGRVRRQTSQSPRPKKTGPPLSAILPLSDALPRGRRLVLAAAVVAGLVAVGAAVGTVLRLMYSH